MVENNGVLFERIECFLSKSQLVWLAASSLFHASAQCVEQLNRVAIGITKFYKSVIRIRLRRAAGPLVCPHAFFEKAIRKNNILMDVHLFGDNTGFGLARVTGTDERLPLDGRLCNLVNAHDNLVNLDRIGVQMIADNHRFNFAQLRLAPYVIAGKVAFIKNVVCRGWQLHRQNWEHLLCNVIFLRLKVRHCNVCQDNVRVEHTFLNLVHNFARTKCIHKLFLLMPWA